jgi:hypothetical protein
MMSKVKHGEGLIENGQNTIAAVIPNIIHTIHLIFFSKILYARIHFRH